MKSEKKEKKVAPPPTPFWNPCVKVFFDFVAEKFDGEKPTFDGSGPRDLKAIVLALEKRATDAQVEWTEENATTRLKGFLEAAFKDPWLRDNFVLSTINRQKDKIFFNSKTNSNGRKENFRSYGEKPNTSVNSRGGFGKL